MELTSSSSSNDFTVFGPQWKKNSSVIHGNQCVIKYVGYEYVYHNHASSIAVSVCYVICDTVKGISEKEQANLKVCVLLGIVYSSSIGGITTPIGTGPNGFLIQFLAKEGIDIGFIDWFLIGLPVSICLLPYYG